LSIAERSLEVMLTGTLMATFSDWRQHVSDEDERRYRDAAEELSEASRKVFRQVVHERNELFQAFLSATPVRELSHVHFGSRPAYRERGAGTMAGIRAIPWNFGWTQTRILLTAWLGAGSALQEMIARPGGLELARKMAKKWPFFDDLLGKVEMVCAKADLDIARLYFDTLGTGGSIFDELKAEFERTVTALKAIRERDALLVEHRFLRGALDLRNPYVDALNLLQVSLLQRKRALPEDSGERELLDQALGTTLNGVAQGMRNTG
jgi:phosphoenolpyruvate carboxylase